MKLKQLNQDEKYWVHLVCSEILKHGKLNNFRPILKTEFQFGATDLSEEFFEFGEEVEGALLTLQDWGAVKSLIIMLGIPLEKYFDCTGGRIIAEREEVEHFKESYDGYLNKVEISGIDYEIIRGIVNQSKKKDSKSVDGKEELKKIMENPDLVYGDIKIKTVGTLLISINDKAVNYGECNKIRKGVATLWCLMESGNKSYAFPNKDQLGQAIFKKQKEIGLSKTRAPKKRYAAYANDGLTRARRVLKDCNSKCIIYSGDSYISIK